MWDIFSKLQLRVIKNALFNSYDFPIGLCFFFSLLKKEVSKTIKQLASNWWENSHLIINRYYE